MLVQTHKTSPNPRFLDRWFELTALPPLPANATFREREHARRNRAASSLLLLMVTMLFLTLLIALVQVFFNKNVAFIGIVIGTELVVFVLCWMNRRGWTTAVALIFITVMTAGTFAFITSSPGGLTLDNVKLFDDMVGAVLLAGLLLPAPWIIALALLNIGLMIGSLYWLGSPSLLRILPTQLGSLMGHFLILELQVTFLTLLWSLNIIAAIRRADRAEEIARLEQALATQSQSELEEKQRLEESIQTIIQTHTEIANGNYNVRVPITDRNVLWPIAGSLNNLLNRIQGWRRDSQELQQLRAAIAYATRQASTTRHMRQAVQFERTGTALDTLLVAVQAEQHSGALEQDTPLQRPDDQPRLLPGVPPRPHFSRQRNSGRLS